MKVGDLIRINLDARDPLALGRGTLGILIQEFRQQGHYNVPDQWKVFVRGRAYWLVSSKLELVSESR